MSHHTPPAERDLTLDVEEEEEDEEEEVLRTPPGPAYPTWPPPGSPPDLELQRLVKARLMELLAEEGILVPEPQDS